MNVIKRNGDECEFSREKIIRAITEANNEVKEINEKDAASDAVISAIATRLYERCRKRNRPTPVEEIKDMIETELMKAGAYETARTYIRYRIKPPAIFVPVLYSTGCVNCRTMKDSLDSYGIRYGECNDVSRMIELGFDKVPVLQVSPSTFLDYEAGMEWIMIQGGCKV